MLGCRRLALLLALTACNGPGGDDTVDDTGDTGDTADTSDTDTSDTGGDTSDTSDTSDTADTSDTSDTSDTGDTGTTEPVNSITANPVTLEITGVATLTQVVAVAPGWVVLWDGDCAASGAQRGVTQRAAGTASNVAIETLDPLVTGTYCVTLHVEGANAGSFSPGDDPQALADGLPVEADWSITVPAGTPDFRVTMSVNALTDWRFSTVLPSIRATELRSSGTANDPPITLLRGMRYEFRGISSTHPLSWIQASATQTSNNNCVGAPAASLLVPVGASDADLNLTGTLESDAEVLWVDQTTTPRLIRFTVDPTLGATSDVRYRCGDHEAMCGTVTFADP